MLDFKKIFILICAIFSLASFNTVSSYDRFAKVVIIGEYKSGKTTLYNAIRGNADKVRHTEQISDDNCLPYNITQHVWRPNHGIMRWFKNGKFVN